MDPIGITTVVVALVAALAFALFRQFNDGRFRVRPPSVASHGGGTASRLRALANGRPTFVQFSGAMCSQCRINERTFSEALAPHPEIGFRDLLAEEHMDLVHELGIMRSPTVLFLEPSGEVLARANGVLTTKTIHQLIGSHHD